jgi:glucose 1-dehydrogenase
MVLQPNKSIGESEDITRTAVWIASDHADYITGTSLVVDGGMTPYHEFAEGGVA